MFHLGSSERKGLCISHGVEDGSGEVSITGSGSLRACLDGLEVELGHTRHGPQYYQFAETYHLSSVIQWLKI
jgi:hypothetical protein